MASSARINSVPALLLCLCLLCGCSRPTGGEIFVPAPRNAYQFCIPVEDSLAFYDFSFYTRVDKSGREVLLPREPLRLGIVWKAPSDTLFRETVWLRPHYVKGTVCKYRTGVCFPQTGDWTLSVTITPQTKGFRGLGLVWNSYYGTR